LNDIIKHTYMKQFEQRYVTYVGNGQKHVGK